MMEVALLFSNADYYGVVNHEITRQLLHLPWPASTHQGWYSHVTINLTSTCAQVNS